MGSKVAEDLSDPCSTIDDFVHEILYEKGN